MVLQVVTNFLDPRHRNAGGIFQPQHHVFIYDDFTHSFLLRLLR